MVFRSGWVFRPQRDQVVHRFRFLGRLPGTPGGPGKSAQPGEMDEVEGFHGDELVVPPKVISWFDMP